VRIKYQRQVDLPITFDGMIFDEGLRLDILVEKLIICELKAVVEMKPVWKAQMLGHLRLTVSILVFLSTLTCLLLKTASIELYYNLCGLEP
jgi:GxxExxY protein